MLANSTSTPFHSWYHGIPSYPFLENTETGHFKLAKCQISLERTWNKSLQNPLHRKILELVGANNTHWPKHTCIIHSSKQSMFSEIFFLLTSCTKTKNIGHIQHRLEYNILSEKHRRTSGIWGKTVPWPSFMLCWRRKGLEAKKWDRILKAR